MDKSNWIRHVIHTDLRGAHPGETYWVHAAGRGVELRPHTEDTLAQLRREAPHLAATPDHTLTHFSVEPVLLPANQVMRVHLKHSMTGFGCGDDESGSFHSGIVPPPPGGDPDTPVHQHINWTSTAKSLIFHHSDLITHDPEIAAIVFNYMENDITSKKVVQMIGDLASLMSQMGAPTPPGAKEPGWATLTPMKITKDGVEKTYYQQDPSDEIIKVAGDVMTAMMIATKNDQALKDKKWTQQVGDSVNSSDAPTTGPALTEMVAIEALGGTDWTAKLTKSGEQNGLTSSLSVKNAATRTVTVKMDNTFIRWLGVYVAFYDADGVILDISKWDFDSGVPGISAFENEHYRCLGYVQPVNNFMAIPIISDPGQLNYGDGVDITFPSEKAVSAKIFGCGLGTGALPYGGAVVLGGVATGLCNLAIPTFLMGFAVASNSYKPLYDIVNNKKVIGAAIAVGAVFFAEQFGTSAAHKKMNWSALSSLASILFSAGMEKALLWCEETIVEGEIEDEIPFAGWIVTALNIATGLAQLAETIVEVATSPFYIENTIALTINSAVTVNPDPRHKAWPQGQAGTSSKCIAKMIFRNQARPTVSQTFDIPPNFTDLTIPFVFDGNTLGGQVKIEADFYIDDWLAGKAQSGWMENEEDVVAQMTLYLVQIPVPITATSIFKHSAIMTFQNGAYKWNETPDAPTATIANLSSGSNANEISDCAGLTLSQRHAVLGAAWKAAGTGLQTSAGGGFDTQLYAFQSMNIPGRPMSDVKWLTSGFTHQSELIYDPFPPKFEMKGGQWVLVDGKPAPDPDDVDLGCYYVDPRLQGVSLEDGGGYHLRKVAVTGGGDFDPGTPPDPGLLSYGRFPFFPDHVTVHPSGHMIGVNQSACKVMVLAIDPDGKADADIPVAIENAGAAQQADREGLLFRPIAVGCSYDGTILILDQIFSADTNQSRIQAFDLLGRPVFCFQDDAGTGTAILPIPSSDVVYLDMAVVGNKNMTYIFVLYYTGVGHSPSDYNVAIYKYGEKSTTSDTAPVVTSNAVPAARICVDMWHTLYTLNYQMVEDAAGAPAGPATAHTGPAGRTVTSVSEWLLPVP